MAANRPLGGASADDSSSVPRKASERAAAKARSGAVRTEARGRSTASDPVAQAGVPVATIRLPLFTAAVTWTGSAKAVRAKLPAAPRSGLQPRQLAFYAGAAALGVLEVIEWPVALVVAGGAYVFGGSRDNQAVAAVSPGPRLDDLSGEPSD